jgi:hypothetical protein
LVPSAVTHSFDMQSLAQAQAVPSPAVAVPRHFNPAVDEPPDDVVELGKISSTDDPEAQRGNGYCDFDAAWACFAALTRRSDQASKRV